MNAPYAYAHARVRCAECNCTKIMHARYFRVFWVSWILPFRIRHATMYQRPARERHKIRIALRENVDNQAPRNTNFTH